VDGRAIPQLHSGRGGIDAERTTFGRLAAKVPARRAPQTLERLVRLYAAEKEVTKRRWRFPPARCHA
jgi:sulfite reductase (NADPH) hemoprotein beta-component